MMLITYVRTGFSREVEHIHLRNRVDLYTGVTYVQMIMGQSITHVVNNLQFRSPDGSCLLTNSDDDVLRVFQIPDDILENSVKNELVRN